MWTTTHQAETTASAQDVWTALEALHTGTALGPESDLFELHGPFAVGTSLTITPQGQDPLESVIVRLEPGRAYADATTYGPLTLTFQHELAPRGDGGTIVAHTLTIDGDGADEVGPELGPQISGDFPAAMSELLAAAQRLASDGRL